MNLPDALIRYILDMFAPCTLPYARALSKSFRDQLQRRYQLIDVLRRPPFTRGGGKEAFRWSEVHDPFKSEPNHLAWHGMFNGPHCHIMFRSFTEAISVGAMASLQSLGLASNNMGPSCVIELAHAIRQGAIPALTDLDLMSNEIDDDAMKALAACSTFTTLTRLNLVRNSIGSRGIEDFSSELIKGAFPRLVDLNLNRNLIGEAGINALSDAIGRGVLKELKHLRLGRINLFDYDAAKKKIHGARKAAIRPSEKGGPPMCPRVRSS